MITQFRIGVLAALWVLVQVVLLADVIYRAAHVQS